MITTAPMGMMCDARVDFSPKYPGSVRIYPQDRPTLVKTGSDKERILVCRIKHTPDEKALILTSKMIRNNVIFYSLSREARQRYKHIFLRSNRKISPRAFDKRVIAVKLEAV